MGKTLTDRIKLIQTGKILRDPESRGPKAIGLTKSKVNEFVPAANGRFHDALDEIEIKIVRYLTLSLPAN